MTICVGIDKPVKAHASGNGIWKSLQVASAHTVADEVSEHEIRLWIGEVKMCQVVHVRQRYLTAAPCSFPIV